MYFVSVHPGKYKYIKKNKKIKFLQGLNFLYNLYKDKFDLNNSANRGRYVEGG